MKELNKVQDLEKCDRRQTDRQMKEGVTDKASTREACASKNQDNPDFLDI